MFKTKTTAKYFSKTEIALWCSSSALIVISFCIFDRENFLTLFASLIGVTSLIFNAKGNPFGQFLMIIFSLLYGIFDKRHLRIYKLEENEDQTKRELIDSHHFLKKISKTYSLYF